MAKTKKISDTYIIDTNENKQDELTEEQNITLKKIETAKKNTA
jgi:hypothetical protein